MATKHTSDSPTKENGPVNGFPEGMCRQISAQSNKSKIISQMFWQRITSWRARMALHMQFIMILIVLFRMNMPVAMVCMMQAPSLTLNASTLQDDMPTTNSSLHSRQLGSRESNISDERDRFGNFTLISNTTNIKGKGEFDWESSTEGLIISGSNILGFVMPPITDYLSRKVGAKRLILWPMLLNAVVTILHPVGARLSSSVLIVLRLLIGLLAGVAIPLVSEVFSWWVPEDEKVGMLSFAFGGVNLGNVLVGLTSGYLCAVPIDDGWPFIFYVQGAICLIWCFLWQLTGSLKPDDHPFVSEEEKNYIIRTRLGMNKNQEHSSPPYKAILTSSAVWGYVIVMIVYYVTVIIFGCLPFYFTDVYQMSVEEVGLITSVGYVVRFIGVLMWGQVSSLLKKTKLSTTVCRKVVQCSGFYLTGVGLVGMGFIRNQILAISVVPLTMLTQGSTMASTAIIPLDIAPRYAGLLSGIFTTLGTMFILPGPILVSLMTSNGTPEEWRNYFWMTAVLFFAGATCFLFLGSAELQSWAIPPKQEDAEGRRVAPEDVARRMTVISAGPLLTRSIDQNRLDFTVNSSQTQQPDGTVNGTVTTTATIHPSLHTVAYSNDSNSISIIDTNKHHQVRTASATKQSLALGNVYEEETVPSVNQRNTEEGPKSERKIRYDTSFIRRIPDHSHSSQEQGSFSVNAGFQPDPEQSAGNIFEGVELNASDCDIVTRL